MLQRLRDQTQGTGFKILVGAIIIVLVLFGFGASNVFMSSGPNLASIGDFEVTPAVLEAETERERVRLLTRMGPDFDSSQIDRLQLQQFALQQLIGRQVITQAATRLGVRAPDDYVNQELLQAEAYQIDGQFNEAVYRQQVRMLGYSPPAFLAAYTDAVSSQQLQNGIASTYLVPEWELSEIVRVVNQRRDIAYLPLTVELFSEGVEIADDDILVRYNEDQALYMTELAVDVSYLSISIDDLVDAPEIDVSEEELQALYDEQRAEALRAEQRDSAHILIQINDSRDEAEALQLITEVAARLNAGEDFGALAEELSEDPGSASAGGELGPVGPGIFAPEFEAALWALNAPGDISAPVATDFGYHIIRLNEIVLPDYPEFATQREALELEVRRTAAQDLLADQALALERAAYDERFGLEGTAESLGLMLHKVTQVSRQAPGDDPLVADPAVLEALFDPEVLDGTNSPAIEVGGTTIVVARVDNQHAPEVIPFEEVSEQIRASLVEEQAREAIAQAEASGLTELRAGESVTQVANRLGSRWQTATLAGRGGAADIPPQVLQAAFALPRPPAGEKSVGSVQLNDGAALITVTRVVQGDINSTTDADVAQIRTLSEDRSGRNDFESFFLAAEDAIGVTQAGVN
ncbi:MAG: SurA N-terminal domain-containing protein [Pseudomonadota bacterium]